jgi:hypothetical protein
MREILAHHASGMNLSEASREMYVSYSAVAGSVQVIKRRLKARTLAQCVLLAYTQGYISCPDRKGNVKPVLPEGYTDVGRGG